MDFPFKSKTHLILVLTALTKNVFPLNSAKVSSEPYKCSEVELCHVLGPAYRSEMESMLQHFTTCWI